MYYNSHCNSAFRNRFFVKLHFLSCNFSIVLQGYYSLSSKILNHYLRLSVYLKMEQFPWVSRHKNRDDIFITPRSFLVLTVYAGLHHNTLFSYVNPRKSIETSREGLASLPVAVAVIPVLYLWQFWKQRLIIALSV